MQIKLQHNLNKKNSHFIRSSNRSKRRKKVKTWIFSLPINSNLRTQRSRRRNSFKKLRKMMMKIS